ncbi:hypothetical protein VIGAN_01214700 [Vigna angularis var. angularis]|uniref:Uncharacterized protein n=1 Tax=Vigna angularis var. angularis TaxID=157739 RepID=A0A0S3R1K3_PHAAN|nr:hypothetical protein VIGAN_01214700 [Vigna angularis var. angularis]
MTVRSPLDYQVAVIGEEGKSLMFSDGEVSPFSFQMFSPPLLFINYDEAPFSKPKHTPSYCTASWELWDILWRGIFFVSFLSSCFHFAVGRCSFKTLSPSMYG